MTDTRNIKNDAEREDARIGYQVATNLWSYEGTIHWNKFHTFLVANSIVFTGLILILTNGTSNGLLPLALPVVGLILCLIWLLVIRRGLDYYKYWIFSARELEESHLSPTVNIVSRGGDFADGREVTFTISGSERHHRLSCISSILKVRGASYLLIAIFAVLYVLSLIVILMDRIQSAK